MKVVLFCGGLGTRIREYSEAVPKPMIPIGHQPILWHVMNYYSQYGHKDFVLCLGYKANTVKDFFLNYKTQTYGDVIVEGAKVELLGEREEDWRVAMIDTGVCSAGLSTTQLPAASAGASFQMAISSGKFHGMIWPTTPRGSWKWYAIVSLSISEIEPSCARSTPAK